jgi:hypothetical protein
VAAVHTREKEQLDRAIIEAEQDADTFCREIRSKLNTLPEYIEDQDELLYKEPRGQLRLIIPKGLVTRITRQHNDSRYETHAGIRKTQQWLQTKYYWTSLHQDVEDYVRKCDKWARMKPSDTN